jgi:hypothetical protein
VNSSTGVTKWITPPMRPGSEIVVRSRLVRVIRYGTMQGARFDTLFGCWSDPTAVSVPGEPRPTTPPEERMGQQ